jgi:hypothetical protein
VTPLLAPSLHGFGARYDLPISLALYLYAAAGVIVLSFVMVAVFAGDRLGERAVRYPRWRAAWLDPVLGSRVLRALGGVLGVLGLVAIVVTGLLGSGDATRNPAEYLTWIYFWAGLVILSGLVGNLWTWLSPFRALHSLFGRGGEPAPRRLPGSLGIWPAAAAYLAFACLELTSGEANRPWLVAVLALAYTGVTLAGMAVFGAAEWLGRCEAFTVLFGIVGRFGPLEVEEGRAWLRPWGVGLLRPWPAGWDRVVFVVLMLSTLAFDGILATPLWQGITTSLEPLWLPLGQLGFFLVRTAGLLALTGLFLAVFVAFMRVVIGLGSARVDPLATTTAFALTLVPIALVYNAAHNYSYLVVQSQGIVPLLADPLGRGWHLLPTQGYTPSFLLAGAAVVWYVQVVLIVLGHVIAVYLAHLRASERFRSARNALLSQYPMLLLMVLYTMTSLWILAQPITREG